MGGSTRMPPWPNLVKELTGHEPKRVLTPMKLWQWVQPQAGVLKGDHVRTFC